MFTQKPNYTSTTTTLLGLTACFTKEVIEIAKSQFKTGYDSNIKLIAELKKSPNEFGEKLRSKDYEAGFLQYKDPLFPNYDANKIAGTHFIAAAGPKESQTVDFFKSILFDSKQEVREIVSIGNKLGHQYSSIIDYDFCGYMVGPTSNFYSNGTDMMRVEIESRSEDYPEVGLMEEYKATDILKSKLTVYLNEMNFESNTEDNIKQVNVTLLPIVDMEVLNLSEMKMDQRQEYLSTLWDLYQKYLAGIIAVHCSAGEGRTGQFILTFELLKRYAEIAALKTPKAKADKIIEILTELRKSRPGLVLSVEQFEYAIQNTELLQQFGLQHPLVKVAESKPEIVVPEPKEIPSPTLDDEEDFVMLPSISSSLSSSLSSADEVARELNNRLRFR